jgi:hypothetical protein
LLRPEGEGHDDQDECCAREPHRDLDEREMMRGN